MAQALQISCPASFNAKSGPTSLGSRWTKWVSGFNTYLLAAGVANDEQKRALLLHCAGESVQEIFDALPNTGGTYEEALNALDTYFKPRQNKHFERHKFRSCAQQGGETIDLYVTRLRTLAKICQFHDTQEEIVDQVIEKCFSSRLRKRLLREPDLNLDKVLSIAQSMEVADRHASQYERDDKKGTASGGISDEEEMLNKLSFSRPYKPTNRENLQLTDPHRRFVTDVEVLPI